MNQQLTSKLIFLCIVWIAPLHLMAQDEHALIEGACDKLSSAIEDLFHDEEIEKTIALKPVVTLPSLDSSGGTAVLFFLERSLEERGFKIKKDAEHSLDGLIRQTTDKEFPNHDYQSSAIRLAIQVSKSDGTSLAEPEIKIFGDEVLRICGHSISFPDTQIDKKIRMEAIRSQLLKPELQIEKNEAKIGDLFGVQVGLIDGDSNFESLEHSLDKKGRAIVNTDHETRYAIRLINNAEFDAAVNVYFDGLSVFANSDENKFEAVHVPSRSSLVILGWLGTDEFPEFKAENDLLKQADNPKLDVSMFTATFRACWPTKSAQPEDDYPSDPGYRTSTGMKRLLNPADRDEDLERFIGRKRAMITVRVKR